MQEGVALEAVEFAGPPEARQPDPHLRLERRHARRDGRRRRRATTPPSASRPSASTCRRSTATRWTRSSRPSSAPRRPAAASRSSSSPRRSSARASPRSRARRRRTARAARSSPTPRARASACRAEHFYVSPEVSAFFAEHEQGARRRRTTAWTQDLRGVEGRRTRSSPSELGTLARLRAHAARATRSSARPTPPTLLAAIPEFPADTKIATRKAGPGRAPAARREGAAAHRRQRRSLRLDAELHRRSQGGRRRLQARPPQRAQHPLRHSRARHVLDPERHRRARHLPPERRDVPRLRRLLPRRRSASRRSATCRSSTSSRTTASASARTARRTSRSRPSPACASSRISTSFAPPIPRRRRARSSPRSSAPTARRCSRSRARPCRCSARSRSQTRREGVLKGGYIAKKETGAAQAHPARRRQRAAARARGRRRRSAPGTRVVSMPCFSRFDRQPPAYREEVLPRACRKRVAIEATVPSTWATLRRPRRRRRRHRPLRPVGARRRRS